MLAGIARSLGIPSPSPSDTAPAHRDKPSRDPPGGLRTQHGNRGPLARTNSDMAASSTSSCIESKRSSTASSSASFASLSPSTSLSIDPAATSSTFLSSFLSPKSWLKKGSSSATSTYTASSKRQTSIYSTPSSSTSSISSNYCVVQTPLHSPTSFSVDTIKHPTVTAKSDSGRFSPTQSTTTTALSIQYAKSLAAPPPSKLINSTNLSAYKSTLKSIEKAKMATTTPISHVATPNSENVVLGKLKVRITEATGLKIAGQTSCPYVVCTYDSSEYISAGAPSTPKPSTGIAIPSKTTSSRQSSNLSSVSSLSTPGHPTWQDEAQFDVISEHAELDISIYDADAGDVSLGHVSIHPKLNVQSFVDQWLNLEPRANESVSGMVRVQLSYERVRNRRIGPSDFEVIRLVGKGTFGQVYQVRKKDSGRIYAMKILSKKVIVQKKEIAHTIGERDILVRTALTDSQFIVGLKFSFQTTSDLYLVTDYMSGGELFWHLQKEGRFQEDRAKFYIAELIIALKHLHDSDIVYRDLKPENILLDANGHIALCDFGLSKANLSTNGTTNTFCGTTEYLAPEVLLDDKGYTKMVDFWSLGVLVFEMCCGWSPFFAEDTQQMYKNIAFGKVRFPKDALSVEGRNFVKGLLNRNPRHRLGAHGDAQELMDQPFFSDVDWELMAAKKIQPPFKPQLSGGETDVSNFDPEFTQASTSVMRKGFLGGSAVPAGTPLDEVIQERFKGFTYVGESTLDEHMGGLSVPTSSVGGNGSGMPDSFSGSLRNAPPKFRDDDVELYDQTDIENTVRYNDDNGLSNNELLRDARSADVDEDVGMLDDDFVGQEFEM